jgi:hypothetical protein
VVTGSSRLESRDNGFSFSLLWECTWTTGRREEMAKTETGLVRAKVEEKEMLVAKKEMESFLFGMPQMEI